MSLRCASQCCSHRPPESGCPYKAFNNLQTGFLYHYALAMILGLFVLLTWFTSPLSAWLGK